MKTVSYVLALILMPFMLTAQVSIAGIEKLIPNLQYDNDFMTYLEVNMKDGFNTVKKAVGMMKFVHGQKVYAIEKIRYTPKKQIAEKITFFYHEDTPIAISIEKNGEVSVYYLDNGKVVASKKFEASKYKPFGGTDDLILSTIPADQRTRTPKKKYLEEAVALLSNLKEASQSILNYKF